jgi:hypothetical protein
MDSLIVNQISSAAVVVFLLEFLKKQPWFTWLTEESTKKVKMAFSVVFGALAVAGIGYSFNADAGALTITGLTFTGIVTALWEVAKQFVWQKAIYKLVKKPEANPLASVVIPPPEV